MAGNGTIGLELVEELDDIDTVLDPVGRRRPHDRDRERARAAQPATRVYRLRARDGRAADGVPRCRRHAGGESTTRRRSWTAPAARRLLAADVGARPAAARRRASRSRSTRRPRPCGCSRSGHAWSRRAPARSPSRQRSRAAPATGRIVCIVSGGNIDASPARCDPRRPHAGLTGARRQRGGVSPRL